MKGIKPQDLCIQHKFLLHVDNSSSNEQYTTLEFHVELENDLAIHLRLVISLVKELFGSRGLEGDRPAIFKLLVRSDHIMRVDLLFVQI